MNDALNQRDVDTPIRRTSAGGRVSSESLTQREIDAILQKTHAGAARAGDVRRRRPVQLQPAAARLQGPAGEPGVHLHAVRAVAPGAARFAAAHAARRRRGQRRAGDVLGVHPVARHAVRVVRVRPRRSPGQRRAPSTSARISRSTSSTGCSAVPGDPAVDPAATDAARAGGRAERHRALARAACETPGRSNLAMAPKVVGFESNPEMLQITSREDNVLVTNLEIRSVTFNGFIALCLPMAAIETFLQEKGVEPPARRVIRIWRQRRAAPSRRETSSTRTSTSSRGSRCSGSRAGSSARSRPDRCCTRDRRSEQRSRDTRQRDGCASWARSARCAGSSDCASPNGSRNRPRSGRSSPDRGGWCEPSRIHAGNAVARRSRSPVIRSRSQSFDALLDIAMPVAIEIGRASMTVQEILQLGIGSVVQLDRIVGEPVDIYVSDRKFAQGEVVVVGEHFGVRITKVLAGSRTAKAASERSRRHRAARRRSP